MRNFIGISREIIDHWIYQDAEYFKTWFEMLYRARFAKEPSTELIEGQLITLERGDFVFGRKKWSQRVGISENRLRTLIKKLIEDEMIEVVKKYNKFTVYKIKNYEKYNPQNNQQEELENKERTQDDNQQNNQQITSKSPADNQQVTTKEESNKDNKDKKDNNTISSCEDEEKFKFPLESIEYRLADYLRKHILKNNPKIKVPVDSDMDKWSQHIDYMIRLDKRSTEDIKAVIEFSQKDEFWMTNILSTAKLRKQFDQLYLKSQQKNKPKSGPINQPPKHKTKFHLAKSRGDRYTADELEELILNNQRNKRNRQEG